MQDFVPAHHGFAQPFEDFTDTLIKIGLQRLFIGQTVALHKCLNIAVFPPVIGTHLVTADMHIGVGEKLNHLSKKVFEKLIDLLPGWIEGWPEDAPGGLQLIRSRRAAQLGIGGKPGAGMSRHIELRHDAYTPIGSVIDQFPHLRLGVVVTAAGLLVQTWVDATFDSKPLVVGEM